MNAKLKVIVVSAIGSGLLMLGLWFMGRSSGGTDTIEAHFTDVVGLTNNAPVLYRGVKVGEVTKIEALDESGTTARLTIGFNGSKDFEVNSDVALVLRLQTLLGAMFIDIDPGNSGKALDGPVTATHRDTSLDTILFQGAALYDDLRAAEESKVLVDQIKAVVRNSGDDISAIVGNTKTLTDGLASRVESVSTIISNLDQLTQATEGRAGDLGVALVDVNTTLAKVRDLLERNRSQIESLLNTISEVIDKVDLAAIDEVLAKAPATVEDLDRGVLILRALLQGKLPAMGNLVPLPYDLAEKSYDMMEDIAQTNPILRQILIKMLDTYLT